MIFLCEAGGAVPISSFGEGSEDEVDMEMVMDWDG